MARSTKPAMRRVASGGADSATPFILIALIVLLGISGYLQQQSLSNPQSPAAQGGMTTTLIWTQAGVTAAMFFAIIAPLVFLGIFATSKIFNFKLYGGNYVRAAAIAAIPIVATLAATFIPPNPVVRTLLLIVSIPLAAMLARGLFDLSPIEMLAAAAICVPLFAIGMGISSKVTTMALSAGGANTNLAAGSGQSGDPGASGTSRGLARSGPADPAQVKLDALASRLEGMGGDELNTMTREQFTERLASLQTDLEALKSAKGTTSQWQRLSGQIRDLAPYGQNLPSEKPDDALFQPMATSQNWSNVSLNSTGEEASFDAFNIRLPPDARLDLKASDPSTPALTWTWQNSWSTLSLKLISAPDARQKRPWVVTRAMMQRFSPMPRLFIIDSDQPTSTAGNLADATFFRIERSGSANPELLYAGLIDGKWLIATISGAAGSEARNAFEGAVKSLRKRSATEAKSDPLAPALLVKRLSDDPDTALALLKKQGPASEDALLSALSGSDTRMKVRVLEVLSTIATSKSSEALRPLAESTDPQLSTLAISALKRVAPQDYDDIAMAVIAMKRGNTTEKRESLAKLAAATKDPARPQIAREIETVVLAEDETLRDIATRAMVVWADAQSVPKFLPWVDQNARPNRRTAAFAILPATKDTRVVLPLLRWVIKEPDDVVKAVVAFGPAAEDEVIRQLFTDLDNNRNPEARKAGARILQEIGSAKSLPVLQRASNDPRDATAAQIAKVALDTLRQRVQPARGPTTAPRGR